MIYLSGVILFLGLLSFWKKRPIIVINWTDERNSNTGTQWYWKLQKLDDKQLEDLAKEIHKITKLERALR